MSQSPEFGTDIFDNSPILAQFMQAIGGDEGHYEVELESSSRVSLSTMSPLLKFMSDVMQSGASVSLSEDLQGGNLQLGDDYVVEFSNSDEDVDDEQSSSSSAGYSVKYINNNSSVAKKKSLLTSSLESEVDDVLSYESEGSVFQPDLPFSMDVYPPKFSKPKQFVPKKGVEVMKIMTINTGTPEKPVIVKTERAPRISIYGSPDITVTEMGEVAKFKFNVQAYMMAGAVIQDTLQGAASGAFNRLALSEPSITMGNVVDLMMQLLNEYAPMFPVVAFRTVAHLGGPLIDSSKLLKHLLLPSVTDFSYLEANKVGPPVVVQSVNSSNRCIPSAYIYSESCKSFIMTTHATQRLPDIECILTNETPRSLMTRLFRMGVEYGPASSQAWSVEFVYMIVIVKSLERTNRKLIVHRVGTTELDTLPDGINLVFWLESEFIKDPEDVIETLEFSLRHPIYDFSDQLSASAKSVGYGFLVDTRPGMARTVQFQRAVNPYAIVPESLDLPVIKMKVAGDSDVYYGRPEGYKMIIPEVGRYNPTEMYYVMHIGLGVNDSMAVVPTTSMKDQLPERVYYRTFPLTSNFTTGPLMASTEAVQRVRRNNVGRQELAIVIELQQNKFEAFAIVGKPCILYMANLMSAAMDQVYDSPGVNVRTMVMTSHSTVAFYSGSKKTTSRSLYDRSQLTARSMLLQKILPENITPNRAVSIIARMIANKTIQEALSDVCVSLTSTIDEIRYTIHAILRAMMVGSINLVIDDYWIVLRPV